MKNTKLRLLNAIIPTFIIEYFGRGSERFQLWASSSFTEQFQKQYLERNIVRLGQIKKELFGKLMREEAQEIADKLGFDLKKLPYGYQFRIGKFNFKLL